MLESQAMLDAIREAIEWLAGPVVDVIATLLPYLLLGLAGLYVLWLVVGYLRVSQVGVNDESATRPTTALPKAPDGAFEPTRGVPYCPIDALEYPPGARFCTRCESDLSLSCANCGSTIRASAESCFRCGSHSTMALPALH
jgi:Double zinc ribbon